MGRFGCQWNAVPVPARAQAAALLAAGRDVAPPQRPHAADAGDADRADASVGRRRALALKSHPCAFVFGFISSRFLFVSSFRVASLFFIRGFKPRLVSLRQILTHVPHNVSIFFKPKSLKKRIISMNPRVFVLLFVSLCFVFFCCGFFLSWMFSNLAIFFRNTRHVRL